MILVISLCYPTLSYGESTIGDEKSLETRVGIIETKIVDIEQRLDNI